MRPESFDPSDLSAIPDLPVPRTSFSPADQVTAPPASERGPTRDRITARRRFALGVSCAWLAALVLLFGLRHDLAPSWLLVAHVGLPAMLAAAALVTALSPGPAGVGPRATTTVALAVGAPLSFALIAVAFPKIEGSHPALAAFFCGDVGLLLGALPLAALAWAQRRTCVSAAPWRSALIGVSMGLLGAATLGMHCANGDGFHVALGHGWPVIVLGVVGLLLVGRVTRVR